MRSTVILLSTLLFSVISFAQYDVYDTDTFFASAQDEINNDNYDKAIEIYQQIHPSDPRFLEAQIQTTYILFEKEDYDKTINLLEPLYKEGRFKENPQLYVLLGSAYSDEEKFKEAEKIFKEGEEVTPNYGTLMFNLAILYQRLEDDKKALHYIKRTMDSNPNISSAHYLLSSMAFENGQVGLGCLAAIAYLANSPEGTYAGDMILAINEKMGSHYLEETGVKLSDKGDDFSNLDMILRNEFPLDRKYKLNCSIDDIYTRHVQAVIEYAAEHKVGNGYFEKIYIPYLADIHKKGYTEHFQYWTMRALTNGDIGKEIQKKEKEIIAYVQEYYQTYFWNLYSKRTVDHFGKQEEVNYYLENNVPYLACTIDKNGEIQGYGKFLDKYGRKTGKVFYKESTPEGDAEYYDTDGNLEEKRKYADGNIDGENIYFNKEGNKIAVYQYKDGKRDGIVKTYYADGSESCKVGYSEGKLNGIYTCNYENGQTKFKANYKDDKLDGEKLEYEADGTLTAKEYFKDNFYDGTCIYYNPNTGEELSTIIYKEGNPEKSYTRKNNAGNLTFEYIKNGDKEQIKYYDEGELDYIRYLENDVKEKYEYYDNGKMFLENKYKNDKLSYITQYTAKDPKGKKLDLSNAIVSTYDGNKMSNLKYENGKLNGLCKYYYPNGKSRSEITYVNGDEHGVATNYNTSGTVKRKYNVKSDTLNGLYTNYDKGIKSDETYYNMGEIQGPFYYYWKNGELKYNGFYHQGNEQGETKKYRSDGSLSLVQKYDNGDYLKATFYNLKGNKEAVKDFTKDGPQTINYKSFPYVDKYSLKNGKINGKNTRIATNGDVIYDLTYVNGKRNGSCKYHHPSGNLNTESIQKNNKTQGPTTYFDHMGLLYATTTYVDSKEYGLEEYFYPNGSKRLSHSNVDDKIEGEQIIYNQKDEPVVKLYYDESFITSFWVIGQEGTEKLGKNKKTIEGKYPNGKTAVSISVDKMLFNGAYKIFSDTGSPIYTTEYKNSRFNGKNIFYRENGKKYVEANYTDGGRNGETTYYDENGDIAISYKSKNGDYHGDYKIYKNGKLVSTKTYFDDELIEIK